VGKEKRSLTWFTPSIDKNIGHEIHGRTRKDKKLLKERFKLRSSGFVYQIYTTAMGFGSQNRKSFIFSCSSVDSVAIINLLGLWQGHALLSLVLASAVLVGGFADFIGFQEQYLRHTFIGVNLGWQGRGI
jgi:hypothetical protein